MSSMPQIVKHLNLITVGTCVCVCVCARGVRELSKRFTGTRPTAHQRSINLCVRACACVCHDQWSLFCECVHISVIIPVAASLHCLLPGVHGDGDITNTENLLSLQEHVFKGTEGQGVHFVMGDGVSRRCSGGVAGVVGVWQLWWGCGRRCGGGVAGGVVGCGKRCGGDVADVVGCGKRCGGDVAGGVVGSGKRCGGCVADVVGVWQAWRNYESFLHFIHLIAATPLRAYQWRERRTYRSSLRNNLSCASLLVPCPF